MKLFFKEILKAFFVGTMIFLVFIIIYMISGNNIKFDDSLLRNFLRNLSYSMVIYLLNAAIFIYFMKKHPKTFHRPKNMLPLAVITITLSMLTIFLIRYFWVYVDTSQSFSTYLAGEKLSNYWVSFLIVITVWGIFYGINYYKNRQDRKVKASQIIAGNASAQYESLKNQLDPHFLFNSLNVLTSLIEENPDMAQKFTTDLSKIYRYVLEQKDKEVVSLEEEIKFAKTYMNLLKVRFEDGLQIDLPDHFLMAEAKVVPLSLQLLLENSIKHNKVGTQTPLKISIQEKDNQLIVSNNLQVKETLKAGSGVGLKNIANRYALITDREVRIEKTKDEFKVYLPLLTKKVTAEMNTPQITQQTINETNAYLNAKEQVKKQREFFQNLISYLIIIPALAVFNFIVTPSFLWFFFPLVGWGLGVAAHGMSAFDWNPFLGKGWEERKIKEIMSKNQTEKKY